MPRYYWSWSALCTVWQTVRTKRQLQQCKSQQTRNLIRLQREIAQGICRAAGTISGFSKGCQAQRTPATCTIALYQFDIDVLLQESWQHVKLLGSLWSLCFAVKFALWQILSWYLQWLNQIEPISMWRQSSHWKNKYFVIWWLVSKQNMIFQ